MFIKLFMLELVCCVSLCHCEPVDLMIARYMFIPNHPFPQIDITGAMVIVWRVYKRPGKGVRGAKPPEAESILSFTSANGVQICQF